MKLFKNLVIFVVALLLLNTFTNAQIIITKLGIHPFYKPSLKSEADLFNMIGYNVDDIKQGFELSDISSVFDDFMDQVFETEITKVNLGDGTQFDWMFHRKNGRGPILIAKDITWINKESFEAFQFHIDSNNKRYTFIVPMVCSNLSLRGVTRTPIGFAPSIHDFDKDVTVDDKDVSISTAGLQTKYENDRTTATSDKSKTETKKVSTSAMLNANPIDINGDGITDGYDINGDGKIDTIANIDLDGDGIVDGYDVDGDGKIDIKETATLSTEGSVATMSDDEKKYKKSCIGSHCGKPDWRLGLHLGYPIGSAPEDETLNFGALLETPLGVVLGPLKIGLGAGVFTYNFEDLYLGGGLLASLCFNDLLKLDIPLILQLHGAGFYVFGEDSGPGFGGLASASMPISKVPISLGLYGGVGKYYPGENDYDWSNLGLVLYYEF